MVKKICVYTCITGDYDNIEELDFKESEIDYYLFTNNKNIVSKTWKVTYVDNDLYASNKIIYAVLKVKFRNFIQTEYFKIIALPS